MSRPIASLEPSLSGLHAARKLRSFCLAALLALGGCGDCEDELRAAKEFLDANQSCEVDDDCVAVSTGCETLPGGLCGQSPLNRRAAESARWKTLKNALDDCSSGTCNRCLALLVPSCKSQSCARL